MLSLPLSHHPSPSLLSLSLSLFLPHLVHALPVHARLGDDDRGGLGKRGPRGRVLERGRRRGMRRGGPPPPTPRAFLSRSLTSAPGSGRTTSTAVSPAGSAFGLRRTTTRTVVGRDGILEEVCMVCMEGRGRVEVWCGVRRRGARAFLRSRLRHLFLTWPCHALSRNKHTRPLAPPTTNLLTMPPKNKKKVCVLPRAG